MVTVLNVLFIGATPCSRLNDQGPAPALDREHGLGCALVEVMVQLPQQIRMGRIGKISRHRHSVNFLLHAIVGHGLLQQVALVIIAIPHKRPLNVPGARIMSLDQVTVVGVHDPNEVGKVDCSSGVKSLA